MNKSQQPNKFQQPKLGNAPLDKYNLSKENFPTVNIFMWDFEQQRLLSQRTFFKLLLMPSDRQCQIEAHEIRRVFGRGSRVVRVSDHGWSCHEFVPRATKDPPCRGATHVKSIESSNVFPLVRCGS
ncbi:hypothetical protein TNCV_3254761 [Trichonephila clavipes]|nr:hypothetical protein TNCV_3254761 [Trichonephila clavipes]